MPETSNINMKRFIITSFLALMATTAIGQPHHMAEEIKSTVKEAIDNPALANSVISICARTGDGRMLLDVNSEDMIMPASNMKLISTGASLHTFGPDFRFQTSISHDGEIIDGTLHGNIYITGGADPTIGSKDSIAVEINTTFREWEALIRKAGISRIEGRIIGDGRYFDGMAEEPSWMWSDIGTYYGTGTTGLMFYENMQSFNVSPGKHPGDSINITASYPDTPWMEFRYSCSTGEKGTGDMLYMYTSDLAPIAEIRGTFGVDRGKKRVDCSNKFPEYTCADYFCRYLRTNGIECEGAGDFKLKTDWKVSGEKQLIGKTESPALSRIIFETNHASNNLYAETLLRHLGKEMTGSACYDSSYVALNMFLEKMNISRTGLQIQDGSGLSRKNYVSADFLCRFLEAMMGSPYFEAYVESLPHPGGNGTLAYNMSNYPSEIKERIRMKSGSMGGVRCYSGYIIPTEGCKEETIIFSVMVNNCTAPTWKLRSLLDNLIASLAELN